MEDKLLLQKIDTLLIGVGGLGARLDGIEKKIDSLEKEILSLRDSSTKSWEKIIRLEEFDKNVQEKFEHVRRDFEKGDRLLDEKFIIVKKETDEKIDKELLRLKLTFLLAVGTAIFAILQFALKILKVL